MIQAVLTAIVTGAGLASVPVLIFLHLGDATGNELASRRRSLPFPLMFLGLLTAAGIWGVQHL